MRTQLSVFAASFLALALAACGEPPADAPAPDETAAPETSEAPDSAPAEDAAETDAADETASDSDGQEAASDEAASEEAALWPHEGSDLEPDPDVRYGVLENGMRYAVMQNDTPSGTGAVRLRFDVGALAEADDQQGLAHFTEHMIFNGSENVEEGEMIRILERHGLAFGPDTNAYTSFDETVYQLDLPAVDDETLDTAFFLMRETAGNVSFDAEAIDRERGVVLSELRVRNTYGYRYTTSLWSFLFPEARFPSRWPIGTAEVLQNAPRERFLDLYQRYYTPERAMFVFVGDVEPDEIVARIEATFSDWTGPDEPGADPDLGEVTERPLTAGFFYDPDMPTVVTIAAVSPAVIEPDTMETRRRRLTRSIGASVLSRRLGRLARAPDAPFVQAEADFSSYYDTADVASIDIVSRPDDWREAMNVVEQELRRAIEFGFTQAEINEQIANIRTGLRNSADQAETRESRQLADGITGSFGGDSVFTHPQTSLERFETYADELTPEAVWAAFREGWDGRERLLYLATNEEIENAEAEIVAAYEASAATPVEAQADAGAQEFAYTDFGPAGEVVSRDVVEDLDITRVRFANNVRLNVKQTDFESDVVRVSIRFGGGDLELPMDAPGLGFMLGAFVDGGLEAHSLDELETILAGRTVTASIDTNEDSFGMGSRTTPTDFELQMQLFAAYLTAPGYREEGLTQFRQTVEIWYETLDATPQSVAGRDVPRLIRSGDPRFGIPSEEELLAHDFEAFEAMFRRAREEGAIEIGVVGDIDVDTVIDVVSRTFAALPERLAEPEPFTDARNISFPDGTAEPVVLHHAGEADRALANVYWPSFDDSDVLRARRVYLLQSVLDLKLIDRVREELGATYSPSAFSLSSSTFKDYGYIGVSLDLEPDDVASLFTVVDEIVASIVAGDISEDEIDRARRPILEQIEENLEQNEYWLRLVSVAQTMPEELERHRLATEHYSSITPEELVAIAAEQMQPELAYRIEILPTPEQD